MQQPEFEQIGDELYFVAASPVTRRLRTQAELLSQTDVPVLITGESGSGKATTARLIHSLSIRSSFEFKTVSCAALTADLLDSELFGCEKVGERGRLELKPGKFEQCAKGTILLDDIETMPTAVQSRLLQLLKTREFARFGGQSAVRVDVRILATTESNLERVVAEKKILDDLYYQLSAFDLHVPALRERREEIPLLLGHFMQRLTCRYGVPAPPFSAALLDACQNYSWPGNLRELEVFVKRFLVFRDEGAALEELQSHRARGGTRHFNAAGDGHTQKGMQGSEERTSSLKSLVRSAKEEAERSAIAQALEETHWNRKAAARLLSVSYRALLYKIQEYQIVPSTDSDLSYSYSVKQAK